MILETFIDKLKQLKSLKRELENEFEIAKQGFQHLEFKELTALYMHLRELANDADEIKKIKNTSEPVLAEIIRKFINGQGLEDATIEFGGSRYKIKPDIKPYPSISEAKEPDAIRYLRDHPIGREYIKEKIVGLGDFIRVLAENGESTPDGLFSIFVKETLSVRKLPDRKV